jgi:phosphatidylserine/phosphatidylglycerophosphate/cardiolipin synthase-like enzyme
LSEGRAVIAVHASREPLHFDGDIMHNKFVIADGRKVWTGSANLSNSCTGGYNANACLVIDSQPAAAWFDEEFERLFSGLFHRRKTDALKAVIRKVESAEGTSLQLGFCPQDYCFENIVEPAIQSAKTSIDVAVFFLTHKRAAGELIKAHQRGVRVRVILDATAAGNGYTKHELLRAAGIPVKVENWGGKMHMKCALIDGRKLIAGSMNWTTAGERNNDENVFLIDDREAAKKFAETFEQMWESIPERWLTGRPDPESPDSPGSETDGIDNDFDELIDAHDPGCGQNPSLLESLPPYRIVPLADGYGLIKGNISEKGERLYHLPGSKFYDKTRISTDKGERWFPSIIEAKEAGWRPSKAK